MKLTDKIEITNEDNMVLMARYPDKYFDLAIVDPPYGINADKGIQKNEGKFGYKKHRHTNWDNSIPSKEYFNQLFRVSKNQIIWGGNYFTQYLKPVMSWIVWDKMQYNFSFSHGEMAWNSFNTKLLIFKYARGNESGFAPKIKTGMKQGLNIHPTQKPIALYKYCLETFANPNDKILDTHLGSGSIAIACHDYGFDLTACELDKEYFDKAIKRINNHVAQLKLI
jgi:site-specific DNA-methyltransferase (adenine-specific)